MLSPKLQTETVGKGEGVERNELLGGVDRIKFVNCHFSLPAEIAWCAFSTKVTFSVLGSQQTRNSRNTWKHGQTRWWSPAECHDHRAPIVQPRKFPRPWRSDDSNEGTRDAISSSSARWKALKREKMFKHHQKPSQVELPCRADPTL